MRVFLVVLMPHKPKRLKAGGALCLVISAHLDREVAKGAAKTCNTDFPSKEGTYIVEPWSIS